MDLTNKLKESINEIQEVTSKYTVRPKVYFEEWDQPRISCIRWISELISVAGGDNIFSELSKYPDAKSRTVENDRAIIERNPDIYIASWCGKPFNKTTLLARKGWEEINAIKNDEIHEIDAAVILQPGPAALTAGVKALKRIISNWQEKRS
jgi:iron complex transport system substrate-binding protein